MKKGGYLYAKASYLICYIYTGIGPNVGAERIRLINRKKKGPEEKGMTMKLGNSLGPGYREEGKGHNKKGTAKLSLYTVWAQPSKEANKDTQYGSE